jgi:hypothetical protein
MSLSSCPWLAGPLEIAREVGPQLLESRELVRLLAAHEVPMMALGTVIVIADENDAAADREERVPVPFRVVDGVAHAPDLELPVMSSAVRTFS